MKIASALHLRIASAAALAACAPVPAGAATIERIFASNPAGICQSALPIFDGVIRKRPKAVANEGTSTAFITCAWTSQGLDGIGDNSREPRSLKIYFGSLDGTAKNISCTAVSGWNNASVPSVTKTIAALNSDLSTLTWTPEDFANSNGTLRTALIGVSCSLPPNSAIHDSYLTFVEEIGT